jgi:DNA polymerase sigma
VFGGSIIQCPGQSEHLFCSTRSIIHHSWEQTRQLVLMAAYAQPLHQQYPQPVSHSRPIRHGTKQRFVADLSHCLFNFVIQLLPTPEELAVKEDVRKLLERLIRTLEPNSRLLSFGSTANGFSLRNSGMCQAKTYRWCSF